MIRSWLFVPIWRWLCDAGHVMVLATFLFIMWLGIHLDSFLSFFFLLVVFAVLDRKIERPLRAAIKPAWYLGVLSLLIIVGILLVSTRAHYTTARARSTSK